MTLRFDRFRAIFGIFTRNYQHSCTQRVEKCIIAHVSIDTNRFASIRINFRVYDRLKYSKIHRKSTETQSYELRASAGRSVIVTYDYEPPQDSISTEIIIFGGKRKFGGSKLHKISYATQSITKHINNIQLRIAKSKTYKIQLSKQARNIKSRSLGRDASGQRRTDKWRGCW